MTEIEKEKTANDYLQWFGKNYATLKRKYSTYCVLNKYEWDEDVFSDTYLKIYDTIRRNGLKDTTPQGFDNYTFLSFRTNIKREGQYARNTKRDRNIPDEDLNDLYEEYYNGNNVSALEKIKIDLFKDFSILYIMMIVEANFDQEHFYLFRIKTLGNLTYKQLAEKTKIKASRQKVITVKTWLKENLTKDEIKKAFSEMYGNLL